MSTEFLESSCCDCKFVLKVDLLLICWVVRFMNWWETHSDCIGLNEVAKLEWTMTKTLDLILLDLKRPMQCEANQSNLLSWASCGLAWFSGDGQTMVGNRASRDRWSICSHQPVDLPTGTFSRAIKYVYISIISCALLGVHCKVLGSCMRCASLLGLYGRTIHFAFSLRSLLHLFCRSMRKALRSAAVFGIIILGQSCEICT